MTWFVQPSLVNDPFSDPGLIIDFRFGRRALLFDLGDLAPLSPRQLLRVSHAFVSHAHMDHFAGFDRILRVCLHRAMALHLVGPTGFADRVEHKLKAYTLNLVSESPVDFVITASEFNGEGFDRVCKFRAQEAFSRREVPPERLSPGVLLDEDEFRIKSVVLDMARRALPLHLKRSCGSMSGAKGSACSRLVWGRGSRKPSEPCGGAHLTTARLPSAATSPSPSDCSNNTPYARHVGRRLFT